MTCFKNRQRFNYRQPSPNQRYLADILEICKLAIRVINILPSEMPTCVKQHLFRYFLIEAHCGEKILLQFVPSLVKKLLDCLD